MDREKEQRLQKKFINYAAGFYFDCTRSNLFEMIRNICSTTAESKDYNKFTTAIANVLFKKIYIEEEVWNPGMVAGLINIVLEVLDMQKVDTSFAPANSMLGQEDAKIDSLQEAIIDKFNRNVSECEYEEIREYVIGIK